METSKLPRNAWQNTLAAIAAQGYEEFDRINGSRLSDALYYLAAHGRHEERKAKRLAALRAKSMR